MQDLFDNLCAKVRKAIDDIAPDEVTDSFADDVNEEIIQALEHAATSLLRELPLELLEPVIITEETSSPSWSRGALDGDGSGYIALPDNFLRFVSLKMATWNGTVTELMELGSNAEKMQRSKWSRGSADKPKAMLDTEMVSTTVDETTTTAAKPVLRYWPQGTSGETLVALVYVPTISTGSSNLTCALKEECEKNLIFLTCRIFLEGKKEHAAADKFAQLATI